MSYSERPVWFESWFEASFAGIGGLMGFYWRPK